MRAPKKLDVRSPLFVAHNGKYTYAQISDDMLDAFELDLKDGTVAGPASVGCMVARIRQAESDRDALLKACSAALSGAVFRDDVLRAAIKQVTGE